MGTGRNRSAGWQYAKLSGHENEYDVEQLFNIDNYRETFCKRLNIGRIISVSIGGLHETEVNSVFDDKTKSKTDLIIKTEDGKQINISIKKSKQGQVYLIGVDRFIRGFENQFRKTIPSEIKELLHLFFYGSSLTKSLLANPSVTQGENESLIKYQKKHDRLVWKSLCNWDSRKGDLLLEWTRSNIADITEYCFSRGLSSNSKDWAQYVWYINLVEKENFDNIFSISDIQEATSQHPELIFPSNKNGGSTIQLPFGFVQWHQHKMQFHHSQMKLLNILYNKKL